jgi:hypothetical protein
MTYLLSHSTRKGNLLKILFSGAIALIIYILTVQTESVWLNLASITVVLISLLPSYLWCSGKALGMPIFPLFSLTFLWTYALPLVSNNPNVLEYTVGQRLFAASTVFTFLSIGCIVWFVFVNKTPKPVKYYRCIESSQGNRLFLLALLARIGFNVASLGGWLNILQLNAGEFALLRNTLIAFTSLATFILSYRLGAKELSDRQGKLAIVLIATLLMTSALSFLLINPAVIFLASVVAFSIGRKKVPLLLILTGILCIAFLHMGKGEMRRQYWNLEGQAEQIQIWQYPTVYIDWALNSVDAIVGNGTQTSPDFRSPQSFSDRASVVQMLMMAQSQSPGEVPYLNGKTYEILPQMVIPRIFYPQKPWSHEGTYRLNIHYGRQTREQTLTTTIGWGLLAESYANFGLIGCFGLAVLLGALYGQVGRWSINAPILSLPMLLAIFFMIYAMQSEWTAGVYVAALAQHGFILAAIAIFFMKSRPNDQMFTNYTLANYSTHHQS